MFSCAFVTQKQQSNLTAVKEQIPLMLEDFQQKRSLFHFSLRIKTSLCEVIDTAETEIHLHLPH